jgi:hypothetical protein
LSDWVAAKLFLLLLLINDKISAWLASYLGFSFRRMLIQRREALQVMAIMERCS